MAVAKTWIVTSANSRHPDMNGQTVPVFTPFSNGLQFPGDPNGTAEETAGCQCHMVVSGEKTDYRTFGDRDADDMNQWTDDGYKEWADDLTEAQKDSFHAYSGEQHPESYRAINGHLRRGETATDEVKAHIKNLDEALGKAALPEDTVLYRGITTDPGFRNGALLEDAGFTSASLRQSTAGRFIGGTGPAPEGAVIEMHVEAGTKVGALQAARGRPMIESLNTEAEMILERGLRYRVIRIDMTEVLGQPVKKYVVLVEKAA